MESLGNTVVAMWHIRQLLDNWYVQSLWSPLHHATSGIQHEHHCASAGWCCYYCSPFLLFLVMWESSACNIVSRYVFSDEVMRNTGVYAQKPSPEWENQMFQRSKTRVFMSFYSFNIVHHKCHLHLRFLADKAIMLFFYLLCNSCI